MRAAYLTKPQGNVDEVVRNALDMKYTEIKTLQEITDNLGSAYIIEGAKASIYHQPRTDIRDTSITVEVQKVGEQRVVVGIYSTAPFENQFLEALIENYLDVLVFD